jgi:RHS repeat-associated protein
MSDCPFRYQGQYHDAETGLYYNRFRYYDPEVGNYISKDPIGLAGSNPTLYGYVKSTTTKLDKLGLDETTVPTNLVAFGGSPNGPNPALRPPRAETDIDVDANGMVKISSR